MKSTILILSAFLYAGVLYCQEAEEIRLQKLYNYSQKYNSLYQKQKVYLQPDKEIYCAKEQIWLKAYVFSGWAQLPDTNCKNLYVELWTPSGTRVDIIRIKMDKGSGQGYMELSDTLEQGIYQIRAFTDAMLNYSSGAYCNRNIIVFNPNHSYLISDKEARKNRKKLNKYDKEKKAIDIFFSSEGGNIIANKPVKIYFRAADKFGNINNAVFSLIMPGKDSVLQLTNTLRGLGEHVFIPQAGEKYKLHAVSYDGYKTEAELPVVSKEGIWGTISDSGNYFKLNLSKPYLLSNDPSANRYFVLAHCNNYIYRVIEADLTSDTTILYNKSLFPPGIVNFSVFTNRKVNAANFKIFNCPGYNEQSWISVNTAGDSLIITIDTSLYSYVRNASLSIVEDKQDFNPSINNITELYINSDIDGWVKKYPVQDNCQYLNRLINTSKIIEPKWKEFFNPDTNNYYIQEDNGIVVAGKILTEIFSFPVRNAPVRLEILSRYNDIFETTTNKKGYFSFNLYDFYDTLQMKIVATKPSGRKGIIIDLRNDPIPGVSEYNGNFFLTTKSMRDEKAYRREMNKKASEEAHRKDKELERYYAGTIYGRPDNIVYGYELPENMNLYDALQGRVPGVDVSGGKIIIRGVGTIMGSTDPFVMVDEVPADVSVLKFMTPIDVDRIEIFKGPSAAIFGIRGGNGVIAVYTKRGEFMKKGELDFTLVGYQKPRHFLVKDREDFYKDYYLPKTVLWIPEVLKNSKGISAIKIKKPEPGNYINIYLEGITVQGSPFNNLVSYKLKQEN